MTQVIRKANASQLAFSVSTLPFTPKGELVLGVRATRPESIPEVGDLCLTAGFNTYVPGPAMWAAAADAWLLANLGLQLDSAQCSDFLPVEYDMAKIRAPLKIVEDLWDIKRVAFHRLAGLTNEQVESLRPQDRLTDVFKVNRERFEALLDTKVSFPHEFDFVRRAFDIVKHVGVANIGKLRATWALPSSQQSIKRPWSEHS
jgi:hypothetical protein